MTGGEVVIPGGEAIIDKEGEPTITVVDAEQNVLVVFRREDVSLHSPHRLPRVCPD
jgi:hypothetical protein